MLEQIWPVEAVICRRAGGFKIQHSGHIKYQVPWVDWHLALPWGTGHWAWVPLIPGGIGHSAMSPLRPLTPPWGDWALSNESPSSPDTSLGGLGIEQWVPLVPWHLPGRIGNWAMSSPRPLTPPWGDWELSNESPSSPDTSLGGLGIEHWVPFVPWHLPGGNGHWALSDFVHWQLKLCPISAGTCIRFSVHQTLLCTRQMLQM